MLRPCAGCYRPQPLLRMKYSASRILSVTALLSLGMLILSQWYSHLPAHCIDNKSHICTKVAASQRNLLFCRKCKVFEPGCLASNAKNTVVQVFILQHPRTIYPSPPSSLPFSTISFQTTMAMGCSPHARPLIMTQHTPLLT